MRYGRKICIEDTAAIKDIAGGREHRNGRKNAVVDIVSGVLGGTC